MINQEFVGGSLEEFLREDDLLEETSDIAMKRVLAWQIENSILKNDSARDEYDKRFSVVETGLPPMEPADEKYRGI